MSSTDKAFIKAYSRDLTPEGVLLPEAPPKVRVVNPKNMAAGAAQVQTHYHNGVQYRHDYGAPPQPPAPHINYAQTPVQYGAAYQPFPPVASAPYPAMPVQLQQPVQAPVASTPSMQPQAIYTPAQPQQHVQPQATPPVAETTPPAVQPQAADAAAVEPVPSESVQPAVEAAPQTPPATDCSTPCDTTVEVTSDDMGKPESPRDDIYTVNAIASVNTWAIELASEIDTLYIPSHRDAPGQLDLVDHSEGIVCQKPVTSQQDVVVEDTPCEETAETDDTEYQLAAEPEEVAVLDPAPEATASIEEAPASADQATVEAEVGDEVYALRTNDDAALADVLKQSLREAIQEGVAAAILHAPAPPTASEESEAAAEPATVEATAIEDAPEAVATETVVEQPAVDEASTEEAVATEDCAEEATCEAAESQEEPSAACTFDLGTDETAVVEDAVTEDVTAEATVAEEAAAEKPVAEEASVEETAVDEAAALEAQTGPEPVASEPVAEEALASEDALENEAVEEDQTADVLKMPAKARELQPVWEVDVFQWPEVCCELIDIESPSLSAAAHQIMESAGGNVLAVASVERGVGRTTMAMTLARALTAGGGKVLLIDADVENPGIGESLGLASPCCWRQTLAAGEPAEECAIASLADRITLMPLAEEAAPADSVDFEPLLREIAEIASGYTAVIIDGGPVDALLDGMLAGPHANLVQATLLMNDGRSSDEDEDAAITLEDSGMKAVAMVENFAA